MSLNVRGKRASARCGDEHLEVYGEMSALAEIGSLVPETNEKFSLNILNPNLHGCYDALEDESGVIELFMSASMYRRI